jgi:hypothetical protein
MPPAGMGRLFTARTVEGKREMALKKAAETSKMEVLVDTGKYRVMVSKRTIALSGKETVRSMKLQINNGTGAPKEVLWDYIKNPEGVTLPFDLFVDILNDATLATEMKIKLQDMLGNLHREITNLQGTAAPLFNLTAAGLIRPKPAAPVPAVLPGLPANAEFGLPQAIPDFRLRAE